MPRQRLRFRINHTVTVVAIAATAIDILTGVWARRTLARHAMHIGGVMWLRLQYNAGISFSLDQSRPIEIIVGTIVIVLVVAAIGLRATSSLVAVGFGLLLGGALGNLIDRLVTSNRQVTDFIAVGNFPVFNLADASITVGCVILIVAALRGHKLSPS